VIELRPASEPPDIGYRLAPGGRGRGAMTRALRLVSAYAFDVVGLHRVELYTLLDNVASQRVAERAGFTRGGVAAGRVESRDGNRYDAYVFRLERSR
jgi:RimJ/RimL family protein N-acetyltransferase